MAHAQEPDFVFRRNGRVHLNRQGRQFSQLLAAEVCASAVVMLDTLYSEVVWRVLAIHSISQFPLHFSSRASPCAITFQMQSNCRYHEGTGIRMKWVFNFIAPAALILEEYCRCTLNTKVGGDPRRSWRLEEDTTLLLLSGIEPWFLGCPVRSLVTVHTEVSRLRKEAVLISSNMLTQNLLQWTLETYERRAKQLVYVPRFEVGTSEIRNKEARPWNVKRVTFK